MQELDENITVLCSICHEWKDGPSFRCITCPSENSIWCLSCRPVDCPTCNEHSCLSWAYYPCSLCLKWKKDVEYSRELHSSFERSPNSGPTHIEEFGFLSKE